MEQAVDYKLPAGHRGRGHAPAMRSRFDAALRRLASVSARDLGAALHKALARPPGRRGARPKRLNLALQGGGAHGAFTWGVLDGLLEDGRVRIEAISGTSAGAVNAVALAAGLLEGGREGARDKLAEVWRAIAELSPYGGHPLEAKGGGAGTWSPSHVLFDLMSRLVSPYTFNVLGYNPLRTVLERRIDFKRLRAESPVALFIAATDVASGKERIFETGEITLETVLASACLPQYHEAVKVGRRHYWDGGYSANPPILPLIHAGRAGDTLIVQIDPNVEPGVPTNAQEIIGRLNRITFNAPLRREIALIEHCRTLAGEGFAVFGRLRRRLRRHRFHHIEATKYTRGLKRSTKSTPSWEFLCYLRDGGRASARAWLDRHASDIGRRSTVDLAETFL